MAADGVDPTDAAATASEALPDVATPAGLVVRRARADDWERVVAAMPAWWGGRDLTHLLPRIFFEHFRATSWVADEPGGELAGFLVGFLCPDHADEAYCHFIGVAPAHRRSGLARLLYGRLIAAARADGRTAVRAVTAVVNRDSIAFHRRLGFALLPGELEVDGLPALDDPNVPEGAVVKFELRLDRE